MAKWLVELGHVDHGDGLVHGVKGIRRQPHRKRILLAERQLAAVRRDEVLAVEQAPWGRLPLHIGGPEGAVRPVCVPHHHVRVGAAHCVVGVVLVPAQGDDRGLRVAMHCPARDGMFLSLISFSI